MGAIRVLHVIHNMNCGGAENLIMNLYRSIDRSKVQFDFLVHTKEECFFDKEIKTLGGRIFSMPYYRGWNYLQYKKALIDFFDCHPEILIAHGHLGSCAGIYLQVAKDHGVFTIAHSHNTNSTQLSIKNIVYRIGSFKTRRVADYFFGCSIAAGIDRFGKKITESNRYELLKNAIDTKKFSFSAETRIRIRNSFQIDDDTFVIGHIGRFDEQKNHSYIIEVFKEIIKRREKAKLILVGDGGLINIIKDKVNNLGLTNNVIFAGLRKDVHELLQAFDCFLMPSFYEGLPLSIIEAQASGLKCVVSDKIPGDCIITDNVHVVPLKEPPSLWAEETLNCKLYCRKNMTNAIIKAGFDIDATSQYLQSFYLMNCHKS